VSEKSKLKPQVIHSGIPDPFVRYREFRQITQYMPGGSPSEQAARKLGDEGEIEMVRDTNGDRTYKFSSILKWMERFEKKRIEAARERHRKLAADRHKAILQQKSRLAAKS
jgi:hypothetical protein